MFPRRQAVGRGVRSINPRGMSSDSGRATEPRGEERHVQEFWVKPKSAIRLSTPRRSTSPARSLNRPLRASADTRNVLAVTNDGRHFDRASPADILKHIRLAMDGYGRL